MSRCRQLVVLLTLIAAALADISVSDCSGIDVSDLKDTLRESSCTLGVTQGSGVNATEANAFRAYVQAKHGQRGRATVSAAN